MTETNRNSLTPRIRYLRSQLVAVLATVVDFSVTLLLKEGLSLPYVPAVAFGACAGAATAFFLNRSWVFAAAHLPAGRQAARYVLTLAGSVLLNTAGTYAVTEAAGSHYLLSKTFVAIFIGMTYSYFLLKFFVFAYDKR